MIMRGKLLKSPTPLCECEHHLEEEYSLSGRKLLSCPNCYAVYELNREEDDED